MKAKKVFEMIDPYASEESNMDLDAGYDKVLKEKAIKYLAEKLFIDIDNIEMKSSKEATISTSIDFNSFNGIEIPLDKLHINGKFTMIYSGKEDEITILPKKYLYSSGGINLNSSVNLSLPDEVSAKYFLCSRTTIIKFPKIINAKDYINLQNTRGQGIYILDSEITTKYLKLSRSSISELKGSNINISEDIIAANCYQLEILPDNLTVGNSLYLTNSHNFKNLPDNLTVGQNLYINGTMIKKLPESLQVGGLIFINKHAINYLEVPEHLRTKIIT